MKVTRNTLFIRTNKLDSITSLSKAGIKPNNMVYAVINKPRSIPNKESMSELSFKLEYVAI